MAYGIRLQLKEERSGAEERSGPEEKQGLRLVTGLRLQYSPAPEEEREDSTGFGAGTWPAPGPRLVSGLRPGIRLSSARWLYSTTFCEVP